MTKSPRSMNPHRTAVLGVALMAATTDLQAATSIATLGTKFDADKDYTGQNVFDGSCQMAAGSPMTALQNLVDTAGAAPTHKVTAAEMARTFEINGLGMIACVNSIGIDGVGSASAPAAKFGKFGVALVSADGEGDKAPMALVVGASAAKTGGMATARRHR